jgi:epoxyqueuosine reductase
MNKRNYQRELEQLISGIEPGHVPSLLLHACCAPCSSYCLEYLSQYFSITVLFYNPNISPAAEYQKRVDEIKRLISELPAKNKISLIEGRYLPEEFYTSVKGLENEPEGGKRCHVCYELRLHEAAVVAKELGYDYFTTTLSISPLKDADKLNEIGKKLSDEYAISYLYSDFKKKNGYKRSIELSKEYKLYRQNFCGCVFSKREAGNEKETS